MTALLLRAALASVALVAWSISIAADRTAESLLVFLQDTWRAEGDVSASGYRFHQLSEITLNADGTFAQFTTLSDPQSGYQNTSTLSGTWSAAPQNSETFTLTTHPLGYNPETAAYRIVDQDTLRPVTGGELKRVR